MYGMGGMTPDQRRTWLDQTFFAGIAEAKRPAKFIYRAPLSANTGSGGTTSEENDRLTRSQIESLSKNITGPIYVEFKHNWSHAHSSPDLFHVHGGPLSDAYWNPAPTRHKVVWTMRNEDMFILRWEQPDFVREFVKGVTVNGAFHSNASETISSEDRKTSVVYGTDEQGWSKKRGVKTFTICTFQNFRGLMKISNLTSLNPRGVHVRDSSKVVQGSACEFLDKRDGLGTNSDGFKGGNSSTEISPMRI